MDRFYVTTMRGILLHAPQWVLKIAHLGADRLFYPIDRILLHQEMDTILNGGSEFAGAYDEICERMRADKAKNDINERHISQLLELLEQQTAGPQGFGGINAFIARKKNALHA